MADSLKRKLTMAGVVIVVLLGLAVLWQVSTEAENETATNNSPGAPTASTLEPNTNQVESDDEANLDTSTQPQVAAPLATPDVARNTNVDIREAFFSVPAADIPIAEMVDTWSNGSGGQQNIALGCTTDVKCLGQFRTQCSFSHFGYDDAIVHPGAKNAAHLHMFFGNTGADHNSTGDSLTNSGNSTCNGLEGNRTAYWTPAVLDQGGNIRIPSRIEVYYKSHGGADKHASIQDFPADYKMVAGNHLGDNDSDLVFWQCNTGFANAAKTAVTHSKGPTIPNCPAGERLQGHIFFPQCIDQSWSAEDDWATAKPKLTNTLNSKWSGNCPAGTTKVPLIEVFLDYDVDGSTNGSDGWFLSSDIPAGKSSGETLHADWYGGWNPTLFDMVLDNCITRLADCSWDLVDNGQVLTRVNHFGNRHDIAYTGPNSVSAEEVTRALCPGDEYSRPQDAATCESAASHNH